MNLYIVRHAEALPIGGGIVRDTDRPLTARGQEDAALMGRALARIDPGIEIVMTSSLVRAKQTGEIIGEETSRNPILHVTEHLSPGFRHKALLEEILAISAGAGVIAVGHQPDMGMFIAFLIAESGRTAISLGPGSIAHIKMDKHTTHLEAKLQWLLSPAVVRSLQPV
jgi:phosphohistidine phosphatase